MLKHCWGVFRAQKMPKNGCSSGPFFKDLDEHAALDHVEALLGVFWAQKMPKNGCSSGPFFKDPDEHAGLGHVEAFSGSKKPRDASWQHTSWALSDRQKGHRFGQLCQDSELSSQGNGNGGWSHEEKIFWLILYLSNLNTSANRWHAWNATSILSVQNLKHRRKHSWPHAGSCVASTPRPMCTASSSGNSSWKPVPFFGRLVLDINKWPRIQQESCNNDPLLGDDKNLQHGVEIRQDHFAPLPEARVHLQELSCRNRSEPWETSMRANSGVESAQRSYVRLARPNPLSLNCFSPWYGSTCKITTFEPRPASMSCALLNSKEWGAPGPPTPANWFAWNNWCRCTLLSLKVQRE